MIIDADTHISESEGMWELMDESMHPRRPVMDARARFHNSQCNYPLSEKRVKEIEAGEIEPKPSSTFTKILDDIAPDRVDVATS